MLAMDDRFLRQQIVDELEFEPSIDAAHIGVAVENGVVTLSGHVGSYVEKLAAERAVQRVAGVRAIAEEIEVRYPGDKKTSDDQIAERALKVVAWNAQVPRDAVQVKVQKGWVTLSGTVEWDFQRKAAEAGVRRLSGIAGISNLIEVIPRAAVHDVKERITAALKRNAELEADTIGVVVGDDRVVLKGRVKSWYERELAERAAWSVPGVRAVEDRLTVEPVTA